MRHSTKHPAKGAQLERNWISDPFPVLQALGDGIPAMSLRIAGVRLGDAATTLRDLSWTGGEPAASAGSFTYGPDKVWRSEDETQTPIALQEIVELIITHGGRLHGQGLACWVTDGTLTKIVVAGQALDMNGFQSKKTVLNVLGKPEAVRRQFRREHLTYTSLGATVVVNHQGSIDAVQLDLALTVAPLADDQFLFGGGFVGRLQELHQELAYAGLLEGLPNSRLNRRIIKAAMKRGASMSAAPTFLIQPQMTTLKRGNFFGFGAAESLPRWVSVGYFFSNSPAKSPAADGSHLVVVWFQDRFGEPSDVAVQEFAALPWANVAHDYLW